MSHRISISTSVQFSSVQRDRWQQRHSIINDSSNKPTKYFNSYQLSPAARFIYEQQTTLHV